jgi:type II secretory pathway pseudopilin PulG
MKNRTFLSLLEQITMIAIFAIAATICVRIFFKANSISEDRQRLDQATLVAQNAGETLKYASGDFSQVASLLNGTSDENSVTVFYNNNWVQTEQQDHATFQLFIRRQPSDTPQLGKANVSVKHRDKVIFFITVAWQEDPYEFK